MSRQLLLFSALCLVCIGIVNVPAQSQESSDSNREGYPEKVVPGGTYLH